MIEQSNPKMKQQFDENVLMLMSGFGDSRATLTDALRAYNLLNTLDENQRLQLQTLMLFAIAPNNQLWGELMEWVDVIQSRIPADVMEFMDKSPPPEPEELHT